MSVARGTPVPNAVHIRTARGQGVNLIEGHEYEITTQMDGEPRRIPYRARMSFIGESLPGDLQFNARPAAGTQTLRARSIVRVIDVGESSGRDDPRRYLNIDERRLCPSCKKGEHTHHQRDFLNSQELVTLCRCPIHKQH